MSGKKQLRKETDLAIEALGVLPNYSYLVDLHQRLVDAGMEKRAAKLIEAATDAVEGYDADPWQ